MKFILILLTTIVTHAQTPATEIDKIKSCLAQIYMAQDSYQAKTGVYGRSMKRLGLIKNLDCKGVRIDFKDVKPDSYVIVAKRKKQVWSINDSKTITQISPVSPTN